MCKNFLGMPLSPYGGIHCPGRPMPTFIVKVLGCRVNQYEAAAIAETLTQAGLDAAEGGGPVDLCVVHTCCVTARAEGKARQQIRRLAAAHPQAEIVITGCGATRHPAELRRIPGVTAVLGHQDPIATHLVALAARYLRGQADVSAHSRGRAPSGGDNCTSLDGSVGRVMSAARPSPSIEALSPPPVKDFHTLGIKDFAPLRRFPGRHRAMVKVQDGCDGFCSYCIVPHVRRRIHSRPIDRVIREVGDLVAAGHEEVVLCGVCLGAYGRESTRRDRWADGPDRLAELLARVAEEASPARVRLSSLSPADVTDALLTVMAERENVCPHLHLPLQSGSTSILRRMNRQYTAEEYVEAVARVRARLADPAVTSDVIVGFPGEGDDDFAATLEVARHCGFAKIHIFPFSPRPGTAAARWLAEAPPSEVVRRRCAELADLERRTAADYRDRFVGQTVNVLLEEFFPGPPPRVAGLTNRYLRVDVPGPGEDLGRTVAVRITARTAEGLTGRRAD